MMRGRVLALVTALATALAAPVRGTAQNLEAPQAGAPAVLVADEVFITPERQLIAKGNVEAYQGDIRLSAQGIIFDRDSGQLTLEGPIRIDQGGSVTILADTAEMDAGLQNGLLRGARMVFDQQLQLASLQMTRVGGRYTQLYKTAVTSCNICQNGGPPLWQVRARKITHDQEERQLYLEGAQFLIRDVPVFYFPGLRVPDPTLDRATGFLIPSIRSTSQLGTGVRIPYFIRLGDHRDLTLTPYISSKTRTLGLRYRQAFRTGRIQLEGAYTRDDLMPDDDRGYLFADGQFFLPDDFRLRFDIKTTSDNAYLVDYGLPDLDRLRSEIALERVRRDSLFHVGLIHYKTLRDGEDAEQLPQEIVDLGFQRRLFPTAIGGEVRLGFLLHGYRRPSPVDVLGRDITRATFDAEWLRSWTMASGLRADWRIGTAVDGFRVSDDDNFPPESLRITPRAALTLRYPMTRATETGATDYIEPIFQIGWADTTGDDVPRDESNFVEFDQGNLLDLSRFPAPDAREDGLTAVLGLNWARYAANGWQFRGTVGQVYRQESDPRFSKTSGLGGKASDLLLAGQIQTGTGLSLAGRGLLNSAFNLSKAELRGAWQNDTARLSGTYVWLGRDPQEDRDLAVSEIWLDGGYDLNRHWTALGDIRYDINDSRPINAGLGLIYRNECLTVNISVSRRYTSSESVEPSTDFGLSISLNGFAVAGANKEYRRSCSST
ncbi:LPS-assembly protein [Cribrihabitans marinus]|uniref:LPS-assembly protein LptD n=1 Tax=Cribrihabitans marinus TaxID=1227549 RepID=A0A1H6QN76_9RHOB|nr:LPS assembly protein LptD [Cribrihabitans marinus]GGH19431.1 LPS-assembly protein LptD [Cribrihabitans marinus]SEI45211.1 LPS-assembly protein [Cribrihabitans marinus]